MESFKPIRVPDKIKVGDRVVLMDLKEAIKFFPGNNPRQIMEIMKVLKVPLLHLRGGNILFNVSTLEKALAYLTRIGSPSFAFAGSSLKATRERQKRTRDPDVKYNLTNMEATAIRSGARLRAKTYKQKTPRVKKDIYAETLKEIIKTEAQNKRCREAQQNQNQDLSPVEGESSRPEK